MPSKLPDIFNRFNHLLKDKNIVLVGFSTDQHGETLLTRTIFEPFNNNHLKIFLGQTVDGHLDNGALDWDGLSLALVEQGSREVIALADIVASGEDKIWFGESWGSAYSPGIAEFQNLPSGKATDCAVVIYKRQ